jgi:hypothetical protein
MPDQEINVLRDWDFSINLSGLVAPTGATGKLPKGYYTVTITDMYVNPEKPNRVVIKAEVADGPHKGVVRTDGLSIPQSPEDKVRYYWRGLAESVGYTPAQLDAGAVQLGINTFKGRKGHIHFMPRAADGGEGEFEKVTWLAPAEWTRQKQTHEAPPPAGSALGGAQTLGGGAQTLGGGAQTLGGGAQTLGGGAPPAGGDNTTKAALLAQLGMPAQ